MNELLEKIKIIYKRYENDAEGLERLKTYVMDDGQGTSTYSVHAYSHGGNAYQNNYGQVSVGNTSVYAYLQDSTTVRYGQTTAGNRDNGQDQYHCIQVIEYE